MRGADNQDGPIKKTSKSLVEIDIMKTPEEVQVLENSENIEISINYVNTIERWNQDSIVVDNIFSYKLALELTKDNEDIEPMTIEECRNRKD